jgi:hypothetical protein
MLIKLNEVQLLIDVIYHAKFQKCRCQFFLFIDSWSSKNVILWRDLFLNCYNSVPNKGEKHCFKGTWITLIQFFTISVLHQQPEGRLDK